MIISSLALARYTERHTQGAGMTAADMAEDGQGSPADAADDGQWGSADAAGNTTGTSESPLDLFLDAHFPDERMERIYPNVKLVE